MVRWLCAAIGIILVMASAVTALSVRRFAASATHTQGQVVALVSGASHPRIRFTTADGKTVTFSGSGLLFGYAVGQKCAVFYNPANPQTTATLAAPGSLWFASLLLLVMGLGWLFVPLSQALF